MSWAPAGAGRRSDGAGEKEQQEAQQPKGGGRTQQRPGLDAALYQTDSFRMYIYKITLCRNRDRHDWCVLGAGPRARVGCATRW